jgi:soluble P-type ATPase
MNKLGVSIEIPGLGPRKFSTILSDYTGTLSVDGKLTAGVREALLELATRLDIHVLTANTFGTAEEELRGIPLDMKSLKGPGTDHDVQKRQFLSGFNAREVIALGNGNNDRLLLKAVKEGGGLSIAVDNGEGCAVDSIQSANVFIHGASKALDLFTSALRWLDCRRLERIENAPIGHRRVRNLIVDLLKKSIGFLVPHFDLSRVSLVDGRTQLPKCRWSS